MRCGRRGRGNGYVTRRLLDEGLDAVLLEPGATGAWNGKFHRKIPRVVCSAFQSAGFAANSIPAIGLFDVLEHIENDGDFLRNLHVALQPGGLLCITVPAHSWLWSSSDEVAEHFRRYSLKDLEEQLRPLFSIEYGSYFFSALVLPIFCMRVLPAKLGLSRKGQVLSDATEHGTDSGMLSRILARLLRREVDRIRRNERIAFGASCLVLARKVS